jgi:hypothetical protein
MTHHLGISSGQLAAGAVGTDSIWRMSAKKNFPHPVASRRLETAMPLLTSQYVRERGSRQPVIYTSLEHWPSKTTAIPSHRKNCIKLVNYGGHIVERSNQGAPRCMYAWQGTSRVRLLPTLTSILLFSFSLSSLARYRPALLDRITDSPFQLLIDSFVAESDHVFFSAIRNLLYREELYVGRRGFG